jgi:hypothetical protein
MHEPDHRQFDFLLEEIDAALVAVVELPDDRFAEASRVLNETLRQAESMRDELDRGAATPTEADNFALRCRETMAAILKP